MIRFYYRNTKQKEVVTLPEFKRGAWVYVEEPTPEEIDFLVETFELEEGLLQDALDQYEVPRVDQENGTLYVFTRFVTSEGGRIITSPFLIILKKNVTITVSLRPFPRIEKLLGKKRVFQTTQPITLFIVLFWQIMNTFNDQLTAINRKINSATADIEDITKKDIIQFIAYENTLNDIILALVRSNNVLANVGKRKNLVSTDDDMDLIEDVSLFSNQLVQIANENLRTLVNLREANSTIITNNLNRIIKLFTSLTVVLTIPTIVSSFYGMNVGLPFQNSPLAFLVVLGVTLAFLTLVLYIFYKQDWL